MIFFRKILFYLFLAIYFTVTPLLIFYALGYRFDLKGSEGIVKTGAFSVNTIPEGADIQVNGKKISQKTPSVVLNLRDGDYEVRIEKENYQPWLGKVHVQPERAVVAEKIILIPVKINPETAVTGRMKRAVFFKESALVILLLENEKFSSLSVFDINRSAQVKSGSTVQPEWLDADVAEIYTSEESSLFWIRLEGSGPDRMIRGRVRFGVLEYEDYSGLFLNRPDDLQWDPNAENKVYVLRDKELSLVDLDRGRSRTIRQSLQGFRVYKQRLFISSAKGVFRCDNDGRHPRNLLDDPVLTGQLFEGREQLRIGVYAGGNLLFYDPEGALFSNRLPYWIGRKFIRGYAFDPVKSQAAIWTSGKIGVLDFSRDSFLKEEAFERKLKKRWIYENGSDIHRVIWAVDGTQLFFQDGKHVYLLEAARGLGSSPRFLVDAASEFPIAFSETQGGLFYVDTSEKNLMFLKLVPKREILSDAFAKAGLREETLLLAGGEK